MMLQNAQRFDKSEINLGRDSMGKWHFKQTARTNLAENISGIRLVATIFVWICRFEVETSRETVEMRDSVCKTLAIYHGDLLIRWLVEVFIRPQPFAHLSHNSIIRHNSTWNVCARKKSAANRKYATIGTTQAILIRSIGYPNTGIVKGVQTNTKSYA